MQNPILLDLPPLIQTERLLLRPPQTGDGKALFEAVSESLPELRRFLASMPWVAHEQTPESAEIYCRTAQANFIERKDFAFLLFEKTTGLLVGASGLHRVVWSTPKVEVGFWCRTSRTRHGFISEAVTALADYAFTEMKTVRVEMITDEANVGARSVAERCKFILEGTLQKERRSPDGSLRNACVYARVSPKT